jgi:predicted Zn-dependent peptidase
VIIGPRAAGRLTALALAVGSAATDGRAQDWQGPDVDVRDVSGVQVIHKIREGSRLVAVQLYLLGGTRQVTEETAGVELLLLRAADLESRDAIGRTGSRPTLDATLDWTVTGFVGMSDDLNPAWSGLMRQVVHPEFSDAALERARREMIVDARRRNTEPDSRILEGLRTSAFRGHPYGLSPAGTVKSLTSLSRAEVERFRDEEIVRSRLLLVVVGDVPAPRVDSLVAATLGTLPPGDYEWTLPPELPDRTSTWQWEDQPLPTNYIVACFNGPSPTDSDYFRFQVMLALLSTFLDARIRDREAMSYAAYATLMDHARPAGLIYVSTSTPAEVIDIVREAIADLKRSDYPMGYQPPGWSKWLDGYSLNAMLERMSSSGEAHMLARAHLFFGDVEMAETSVRRLRGVRFRTMTEMSRRYVKDIQLAFMGDTALMRSKW